MNKSAIQHILVVDDEKTYCNLLCGFFHNLGYHCESAPNAAEALKRIHDNPHDLVVTDIRMPGSDGLDLMRQARQKYPDLAFIIMTGFAAEHTYIDIINAGATDFIHKPFDLNELRAKVRRIEKEKSILLRLERTLDATVHALATAVESRDPYTAGHQKRVADLALAIAKEMEMAEEQANGVYIGAIIHDIGKIMVPAEILSKPSRLTKAEFELIKAHPEVGYDILKAIEFQWPIAQIVLQHHERMDGSGYPAGLKDQQILPQARILAVADTVEAMASHRPYRPALGLEKALQEISNNSGRYDEQVVQACLQLFAKGAFEFTA